MLEDSQQIEIQAKADRIYSYLEEQSTKFPLGFLDYRPFFVMRLILIGEPARAMRVLFKGKSFGNSEGEKLRLAVGDNYGPFCLIEAVPGQKYFFRLRTSVKLFDLETGYLMFPGEKNTLLRFDLLAHDPSLIQRAYWKIVKPFHQVLTRRVLRIIKKRMESA